MLPPDCFQQNRPEADTGISAKIRGMKKLLAIFLLLLLPLQSVWAMGDFCCMQEKEAVSQESNSLGQEGGDVNRNAGTSSTVSDTHCAQCHLTGAYAAVHDHASPLMVSSAPRAGGLLSFSSNPPQKPERPKWVAAV